MGQSVAFKRSSAPPRVEGSFIAANYRATITPLIGPRFCSLFPQAVHGFQLNPLLSSSRCPRVSTTLITILFSKAIITNVFQCRPFPLSFSFSIMTAVRRFWISAWIARATLSVQLLPDGVNLLMRKSACYHGEIERERERGGKVITTNGVIYKHEKLRKELHRRK